MQVAFSAMFKRAISQQEALYSRHFVICTNSRAAQSVYHGACNIALSRCVNLMHILERRLIAILQYRYPSCLSLAIVRARQLFRSAQYGSHRDENTSFHRGENLGEKNEALRDAKDEFSSRLL